MADRSLPGVLLIALIASSVIYLAFTAGKAERISVLEVRVPERMSYSDQEYHVVASIVAQTDVAEVDLRLHWLRGIGGDRLGELRESFGARDYGGDPEELLDTAPELRFVWDLSSALGQKPDVFDIEVDVGGRPHRLIVFSAGRTQDLYLPRRQGPGEGSRPVVAGDYGLLLNRSGYLVNFYSGYPAFFYEVEQTLIKLEVGLNAEKSTYENRTPESSLPGLREIPLIGSLQLPLAKDDRLDVLVVIEGTSLRLWAPSICVTEIWADGELTDLRAHFT